MVIIAIGKQEKKLIVIFSGVIALIIVSFSSYQLVQYFKYKPVNIDEVSYIEIMIVNLFEYPIFVETDRVNHIFAETDSKESIDKFMQIEKILRKNNHVCRLMKMMPWKVSVYYNFKDGTYSFREYSGQSALEELREQFSEIPEVAAELETEE